MASYNLEDPEDELIPADVPSVLDALAGDQRGNFFLTDVTNVLMPDTADTLSLGVEVLMGENSRDFRLTVVRGEHGGKIAWLPVIEDMCRDRVLVLGPAALQPQDVPEKVVYVSAKDPGAAAAVENFVAEGMKTRIRQGEMIPEEKPVILRSLVEAALIAADVPEKVFKKDMTLAGFLVPLAEGAYGARRFSVTARNLDDHTYIDRLSKGTQKPVVISGPLKLKAPGSSG